MDAFVGEPVAEKDENRERVIRMERTQARLEEAGK